MSPTTRIPVVIIRAVIYGGICAFLLLLVMIHDLIITNHLGLDPFRTGINAGSLCQILLFNTFGFLFTFWIVTKFIKINTEFFVFISGIVWANIGETNLLSMWQPGLVYDS
ncbi:MAG: hypothetical protein IPO92_02230 [Saprospiraceae bacterium]|nr:hypothetical protein [Saprospiraceae bacterium]